MYRQFGPALRRRCERMLGSTQDAEDVVQTLFIDLIDKGRTEGISFSYLYQAVTARCLNRIRNGRRRRGLLERHGTSTIVLRHGDLAERIITLDVLTQLLDRLDEPLADVFVYLFLDQMTQAEVAELLGTSRKTVGHRLSHIREQLAELWEEAP